MRKFGFGLVAFFGSALVVVILAWGLWVLKEHIFRPAPHAVKESVDNSERIGYE